jgi:hypothetical protein
MSQRDKIISKLKGKWMSNFEIDNLVLSSQGQRRLRELRSSPVAGHDLVDIWVDAKGNIPRHKKFKLIRRK